MGEPRIVDAIVVGGVDFGESDRIVRLLTPGGLIAGFAPAARKSRKRFGGSLEPFTTVRAELSTRRRAGTPLLLSADAIVHRAGLRTELERLAAASYASELSAEVAPEGTPSDLYARLGARLDLWAVEGASLASRRAFELSVLEELGSGPDLGPCIDCGVPGMFLDLPRGGLFCRNHRGRGKEIGPHTKAWLEAVLYSGCLDARGHLSPEDADRAARAVGGSIDAALDPWLDGPLDSKKLLLELGL